MSFDGWNWAETSLGGPRLADLFGHLGTTREELGDPEGPETAADGAGADIEAALSLDAFLSLDADTFVFDLDDPLAMFDGTAEDLGGDAGSSATGPVMSVDSDVLAGDLALPEDAGSGADTVFADWLEPSFEFLSTDDGGDDGAPADGRQVEATPVPAALPAFSAGADDLTGDFIPPPDEPEDEIPVGDVIPPADDEPTTTFIGDDGSTVELGEVPDSFAFLLA